MGSTPHHNHPSTSHIAKLVATHRSRLSAKPIIEVCQQCGGLDYQDGGNLLRLQGSINGVRINNGIRLQAIGEIMRPTASPAWRWGEEILWMGASPSCTYGAYTQ